MSLPLSGLRVLDLTRLLPGGFCTLLFADLGAEVVKVEDTAMGDYIRWAPPYYDGAEESAKSALYLSLNASINAVTHTFGARPYDNQATNLQWLAWLTGGEGLHNNHHAAPTSARLAFRRGEYDPSWPFIRFLRRFGWARVRHDRPPVREPVRAG